MLRTALINIAVLLCCLCAAELMFGGWVMRTPIEALSIPRDVAIHYDVAVPNGPEWHSVYRRDHWGLRGDYQKPSDIDLLTIGGSTTDQRLLSDANTWQAVMAREVENGGAALVVANAGVDGQSTIGHLKALETWLKGIPGLRPKIVLAYVGINDTAVQPDTDYDTMLPQNTWKRLITDRSALYRLWRTGRGMIAAERYSLAHDLQAEPDEQWSAASLAPTDEAALAAYAKRLRQLATGIREWGAVPVFVTQPARDIRMAGGIVLVRPAGPEPALHGFNRTTLAVCREMALTCLDLAGALQFQRGDFYDTLHYTPQGAARIGRWLGAALLDSGTIPRAAGP
ncbi:MAG: SGNH/GDSL hydrolase family protein [Magnetospirillum sp.]|nr:MAG: SGNH/GDSL hydrolase family protein [Magnetospirillum sp.]